MGAIRSLRSVVQSVVRNAGSVRFDDPTRTTPVSRFFGTDRGSGIDRFYIESFLRGHASAIRGRVLEVGASTYVDRFGMDVVECEVLHVEAGHDGMSLVGDLTKPESLPENRYDCFVCTQTLNFVLDPRAALVSAHRVLAPGGRFLATVAGLSQISRRYDMDRWGDFWRFTDAGMRVLLNASPFSEVNVVTFGNVLAAKALLDGLAVEDLPSATALEAYDPDYQIIIGVHALKAAG